MKARLNPLPKAKLSPAALSRLQQRYQLLKEELSGLGWIAQGSLMPQPPNAWRLTRKVKATTISLALSREQALLYQQAIANQRHLEKTLREMRRLTEQYLQGSVPGVKKRRRSKHPKSALT